MLQVDLVSFKFSRYKSNFIISRHILITSSFKHFLPLQDSSLKYQVQDHVVYFEEDIHPYSFNFKLQVHHPLFKAHSNIIPKNKCYSNISKSHPMFNQVTKRSKIHIRTSFKNAKKKEGNNDTYRELWILKKRASLYQLVECERYAQIWFKSRGFIFTQICRILNYWRQDLFWKIMHWLCDSKLPHYVMNLHDLGWVYRSLHHAWINTSD